MKRFLLCAVLAATLPALAQTANPNAKVDPKNNKVSRPVVEKPKVKLMTRDELRSCMQKFEANNSAAIEIKAAQATHAKERAELVSAKDELNQRGQAIGAEAGQLKAEREAVIKLNETLKEQLPKMEKADAAKALADYQTRAAALDARIDAFNNGKRQYDADAKIFDGKVEAHNKTTEPLRQRTDTHLDQVDEWKAQCSNKPYDEADELAVRKELGLK